MANKIKVKIHKSMDETIRKVDGKFVVYPKRGGKRLGTHDTKEDAKKQLAAIEISKAQNEDLDEGRGASPSYCESTPCKDMGFTQKASCKSQGIKDCYKNEQLELNERCQKGYKTHPTRKTKVMFGKRYRNCVKAEEQQVTEADPKKGTGKKSKVADNSFKNELGRDISMEIEEVDESANGKDFKAVSMKIEGPDSIAENVVTYLEAHKLNQLLDEFLKEKGKYRSKIEINEADPKKGTGKKPKGSKRRLYTDENPKDTVSVEFKSVAAIKRTLAKPSFKSKSHKRQSQIINLIHQRARAAYKNAKDPKVKARLKRAFEYAEQRKEASKKKTQARNKKK